MSDFSPSSIFGTRIPVPLKCMDNLMDIPLCISMMIWIQFSISMSNVYGLVDHWHMTQRWEISLKNWSLFWDFKPSNYWVNNMNLRS